MKHKCKTCFRYVEDWQDARAKGLSPQSRSVLDHLQKPRDGVNVKCTSVNVDMDINPQTQACKHWESRLLYNIQTWWKWKFTYKLERLFCKYIRIPLGGLRKPIPLKWVASYDFRSDSFIPNGEPECPHCGEMPYSTVQCQFCGQRFIQTEKEKAWNEPPDKETTDCPVCGTTGGLIGTRDKFNHHFHGECTNCGAKIIE